MARVEKLSCVLSRPLGLAMLLVMTLGGGPMGCSGCGGEENNGQPSGGDMSADMAVADMPPVDMAPAVICEPGALIACKQENTQATLVCSADGTREEVGSCRPGQVCRAGACVDVNCIPGARRCGVVGGAQVPQECNIAGEAFEDQEACTANERCEEGFCLDRCALAERTNSYIGCEYWAVELENHLLDEDNTLGADRKPPFAVVLSNPSDSIPAQITVHERDGETIAEVVPSRVVGTDLPQAGLELVTVTSEVVNAQGQRLQALTGKVDSLTLPPGALMTLILPNKQLPFGRSTVNNTAYKVTSTQPVVAYQFNPLCCNYNYTNDASLLLPKSALTQDYLFMSYAVFANSETGSLTDPYSPTLTVVGTEADTQVSIKLRPSKKEGGRPYTELIYPPDARITGPDAQGTITATLQPFEVLNIAGTGRSPVEDLTGARIRSSKPVAVFGGHTCAFVPFTKAACDHLESQLFPLETWGFRFFLAPLKLRNVENPSASREGTYWKFLAREDNTVIQTGIDLTINQGSTTFPVLPPADEGVPSCASFSDDPTTGVFSLDAGQTCEFGTRNLLVAQADKPISVGAFLSGQNSVSPDAQFGDHAGDPAFFLIPPEEQYRISYAFLTPATYFQSYVMVAITPGVNITLDGQTIDPTDYDVELSPDGATMRAHIPVEPGPHNISAVVPFGIVVYGYDDYVSYAYTGGLNLTKLSVID